MKPETRTELTVLSTALLDDVSRTIACEVLRPDFFIADPRNKAIFTYIQSGHIAGEPISIEWLRSKVRINGDSMIDEGYINGFYSYPTRSSITPLCEEITEIYRDVKTRAILNKYHGMMRSSRRSKEVYAAMEAEMDQLHQEVERRSNRSEADVAAELLKSSRYHQKNKTILLGHDTGFRIQNRMTEGWRKKMYVILALASMGKTALLLRYKRILNKIGITSAFYSLETTDTGIVAREAAAYVNAGVSDIRLGRLTEAQWGRYESFVESRKRLSSIIDDNNRTTIEQLTERARRLKEEIGLEVIFLDYLQLLGSEKDFRNSSDRIKYVSRGLAYIAEVIGVTTINLSQAKREVEDRADKRPRMSDSADGSEIEKAAWGIFGLYRPARYGLTEEKIGSITKHHAPGDVELSVLKNKEGPTGVIELSFLEDTIDFTERQPHSPDGPEIAGLIPFDQAVSSEQSDEVPF